MRVLVCGSRTFEDEGTLNRALDGLVWQRGFRCTTLIHGAARGADLLAAEWARITNEYDDGDIEILAFPADWDLYGKRAGYIRNQQMLDEGRPELVVAFVDKPLAETKGTNMMVHLARDAGVRTIEVECV